MAEDLGARAFAAARALIGVPFRLQGRNPAVGLDCVGLVWAAYAEAGHVLRAPAHYPLRGWERERIEAVLVGAGFHRVTDPCDGDVALIALAARQFHLGIIGAASFVHAHAGLRRVVETPLDGLTHATRWRLCGTIFGSS